MYDLANVPLNYTHFYRDFIYRVDLDFNHHLCISSACGKCGVISEHMLWIKFMSTSHQISLRLMSQDLTDD